MQPGLKLNASSPNIPFPIEKSRLKHYIGLVDGIIIVRCFQLANLDTPIHKWTLPGVPEGFDVYIKRDDMTGSTLSGNKVGVLLLPITQAWYIVICKLFCGNLIFLIFLLFLSYGHSI